MKILVTGNLGYIGSVLVKRLIDLNYEVVGFDCGFFEDCSLVNLENNFIQIKKDIRKIEEKDMEGIDCVIHLAGLSNDPLGELRPDLTENINLIGTVRCAEIAKKMGVSRFIYSSSQSMYGVSDIDNELDEDLSEKNPVTSYARTKWEAELAIKKLQSDNFLVCAFRPSTVFGASPRLRCDIVFNNFVACAYTTKKIEIKSNGMPWRPIVHIEDVCSAFISGLEAPKKIVAGRSFNVGVNNGNYRVKEIAKAAQSSIKDSQLLFTGEDTQDQRTYRVSFNRILDELKNYYRPSWNLQSGANQLVNYFDQINFSESDFRGPKTNRLKKISLLQENQIINDDLFFI